MSLRTETAGGRPLQDDSVAEHRVPVLERRRPGDRRRYTLRSTARALTAPRRWVGRRRADRRFALLDRFDSGVVTLAVALVLLSIADALFTLNLVDRGSSELNPFMHWALGHGTFAFCLIKMQLTAIPVLLLVACSNVRLLGRWRGRSILGTLTGLYAGLVLYEVLLLLFG